jgi:hypothetical protein
MAYSPEIPGPPPGPGVRPPFVAPPTDGAKRRRWTAVGLVAATVLVCCLGGFGGVVSIALLGSRAVYEQARITVTDYLTALQKRDYDAAYALLCPDRRQQHSKEQFISEVGKWEQESFTVGEPVVKQSVMVPAHVVYAKPKVTKDQQFTLWQDTSTAEFYVCGVAG